MRVYLDANIVIYLLDQPPTFGVAAEDLIARLVEQGDQIVVSPLVRMECRVGPLKDHNSTQLAAYDAFFDGQMLELSIADITPHTFDVAAELRAAHGFRPMDALNLATALTAGCDAFATNDDRLQSMPDIQTIRLTP